jgi:hypothetical protein
MMQNFSISFSVSHTDPMVGETGITAHPSDAESSPGFQLALRGAAALSLTFLSND